MQFYAKHNDYRDLVINLPTISTPIYLMGDLHIDSPYTNLQLIKKHLSQAKEENGGVIIIGDLFDLMQSNNDPRRRLSDLLPQLKETSYLNEVIKMGIEFLEPYKENIILLGYGNHELSILNKLGFDIIKEICERLNIFKGGYEGFITMAIPSYDRDTTNRFLKKIFYTHGRNSNAEMTMGILNHKRMDIWIRDIDIMVSGHLHTYWYYEQKTVEITPKNTRIYGSVHHIQLPTYKEREKVIGYSVERVMPPPTIGCVKISFNLDGGNRHKGNLKIKVERVER